MIKVSIKEASNADELVLIGAIRMVSNARAQVDCAWEDVNELMNDGDILEFLSEHQFDLLKTINAIEQWVYQPTHSDKREYNPDLYRGI